MTTSIILTANYASPNFKWGTTVAVGDYLLGEPADQMYTYIEQEYRDRPGHRLHYVTTRELYNIVKAAESGLTGDPGQYRDYVIRPYQTHPLW